ncbi:hypothetical protein [Roseomonas sp. KE2513]|uniref:hypothetical protein n=1 Tax=Roseomonas sp. KE2513 TaxID=2479202 RepID=UPI001E65C607|nr:hypothetical protein [Roseomonas sp. KE2513]
MPPEPRGIDLGDVAGQESEGCDRDRKDQGAAPRRLAGGTVAVQQLGKACVGKGGKGGGQGTGFLKMDRPPRPDAGAADPGC